MGSGVISAQVSDEDLAGMAELFAADVAIEADAVDLLVRAAESDPTLTVQMDVTFGDGYVAHYTAVPVDVALALTQNPSDYNRLLRGQYS